jgi:Tol biopolymer transport system component
MQRTETNKTRKFLWSLLMVFNFLTLAAWPTLARSGRKSHPPVGAQEITGSVHKYDEAGPECSPDGRWLAFEYHEPGDPNYPRIGIMDLSKHSRPWHPLLEAKTGRPLYAGDISWSPDSQWLALWTDYPQGSKSFWSGDSDNQIVEVNVRTNEVVRLTNFPVDTSFGPTTAWLRSGMIIFAGDDQNIYGIAENSGNARKLINVPADKCGGITNTLAASPDGQSIAFAMDWEGDSQIAECNALWIADLRTGNLRRIPTSGLHPLSPFWLNGNTILFSGINIDGGKWLPVGIYSVSLNTEKINRILDGLYLTPFVCDSGKTLYFSWGPSMQSKTPAGDAWSTFNDFYGFRIWRMPLADVLKRHSNEQQHSGASETVDSQTENIHLTIPVPASSKPKQ